MAIQMRRGLKKDFDPSKMLPGEWAVSIDSSTENQIVWMCFAPGVCKRIGTYEDFQSMINEISGEIISEYQTEFNSILDEVKSVSYNVEADKEEVIVAKSDILETYIPQIEQYVSSAESSANTAESKATEASDSATLSQSYAVGGTASRVGEDTDNAKYYYEGSKEIYENFQDAGSVTGVKGANETNYRTGQVNITAENVGALPVKGNAVSATKLQTVRKINGVSFDGTSDIYLPSGRRWLVGSNSANTSGWYKFLTYKLLTSESTHFVLSVTNMYVELSHGILWISLKGSGSPAVLDTSQSYINWMYRNSGFNADDVVAVANDDSTVDFYIRQPRTQYGCIMFQVISEGRRNGEITYTTYSYGRTPLSERPTATVTSKDGGTEGTTVWENADISAGLGATTISIAATGYTKYEVIYKTNSNECLATTGKIPIGYSTFLNCFESADNLFYRKYRNINVTSSKITIGSGYKWSNEGITLSGNEYVVPYKVILYP